MICTVMSFSMLSSCRLVQVTKAGKPLIIQGAGLARSFTRFELNMHEGDYAGGSTLPI